MEICLDIYFILTRNTILLCYLCMFLYCYLCTGSVSPKDKNKLDTDQMECSVGEEKDEIHISTSEDISDDRNDGSGSCIHRFVRAYQFNCSSF